MSEPVDVRCSYNLSIYQDKISLYNNFFLVVVLRKIHVVGGCKETREGFVQDSDWDDLGGRTLRHTQPESSQT